MDVKGLAAVVTGGGSGMGAETARALAAAGMAVAVLDLNEDGVKKTAEEIGGLAIVCNVTDGDAVEAAIDQAAAAHGTARLVVNCAGIADGGRFVGRNGPHELGLFYKVIGFFLIGCFNLLRVAALRMSQAEELPTGERGLIINTASVAAYEGQIGQAAYAASKGGIVGMTLPAARELARFGIRVMTIAPGLIETPMLTGFSEEVFNSLVATTIFPKRLGQSAEYAKLVLHVAENVILNGETIRMDGAVRLAPK